MFPWQTENPSLMKICFILNLSPAWHWEVCSSLGCWLTLTTDRSTQGHPHKDFTPPDPELNTMLIPGGWWGVERHRRKEVLNQAGKKCKGKGRWRGMFRMPVRVKESPLEKEWSRLCCDALRWQQKRLEVTQTKFSPSHGVSLSLTVGPWCFF